MTIEFNNYLTDSHSYHYVHNGRTYKLIFKNCNSNIFLFK